MATEHTYNVNYKLTDGSGGSAGSFTVKDGENAFEVDQVCDSRGIIGTYDEASRTATINGVSYLLSDIDATCTVSGFNSDDNDGTLELFFICVHGYYYAVTSIDASLIDSSSSPFYGNATITTVNIKSAIDTSAGDHFFRNCTALTSITIAAPVTAGDHFLRGCTALTSITIAVPVTAGTYFLCSCTALTSITIAAPVTMGSSSLRSCTALTSITIAAPVTMEGSFSDGCTALSSIYIGTLGKITMANSNNNFQYCAALNDVYYIGSESDRDAQITGGGTYWDEYFIGATWHYNETWPNM